jgi:hypothetical protein
MMRGKLLRLLLASTATVGIASAAHAQMPLPSLEPAPPLTISEAGQVSIGCRINT